MSTRYAGYRAALGALYGGVIASETMAVQIGPERVPLEVRTVRGGWPEMLAMQPEAVRAALHLRFTRSLPVVVRHTSHRPVFVHCHECRWPVNPSRTKIWVGPGKFGGAIPATEAQMTAMCRGLNLIAGEAHRRAQEMVRERLPTW